MTWNDSKLETPFTLGKKTAPNRIFMPPMVTWQGTEDGFVTDGVVNHYRRRSDIGVVIVEASVVSPEGRLARNQLGIYSDDFIEGLSRLAETIHDNGSLAGIQIHHAGRQTTAEKNFGLPILAPSAVAGTTGPSEPPLELSVGEIDRIVDCFITAGRRACEAGFDIIEVHGAHGYLVSQFLSPLANRRTDEYGGSIENRARFAVRIIEGLKKEIGDEAIVSCRLGVADKNPEGLALEDGIKAARMLQDAGAGMLSISRGIDGPPVTEDKYDGRFSPLLRLAAWVKPHLSIPIVGVGEIRKPETGESALAEGIVDFVAIGRALLTDPDWAGKALERNSEPIIECLGCRACAFYRSQANCRAHQLREQG